MSDIDAQMAAAKRAADLGQQQKELEQQIAAQAYNKSAPAEGVVAKTQKMVTDHWKILLAVVVALLVLMLLFRSERFTNRTVDMIAFRNPDPTLYKYTYRIRDPSGMDLDDYYLENDMTFKYGLGPELLGNAAFESRVITEGTVLKDGVSDTSEESFVGGMSY